MTAVANVLGLSGSRVSRIVRNDGRGNSQGPTPCLDAATGRLTYLGSTPTEKQPRGFAIDPTGKFLIASGENSDTISVYSIDQSSGALKLLQKYPTGKGSNWVEIVSFD